MLIHNVIIHPIAGVLWFVGLTRTGDWLHDSFARDEEGKANG